MKKINDMLILHFICNSQILLCSKLISVPLREDSVLRLSEEFFGDPEPCMIHRSAVMSRMYMELLDYFLYNMNCEKSIFHLADIPQRLVSFLDVRDCDKIIVEKIT